MSLEWFSNQLRHFSSVSLLASETEKCPEANSFERDENFASESVSRMSEKLVDVKPGIFKISVTDD